MFAGIWNLFAGCTHKKTTFPLSVRSGPGKGNRNQNAGGFDTYVVCLDCGREFAYSWDEMRIVPDTARKLTPVAEQVESLLTTK